MQNLWSDDELAAAVRIYKAAWRGELTKTEAEALLTKETGRTSVKRRMGNISAVLAEAGIPWVRSWPPGTHVGRRVKGVIRRLLMEP